MKIVLQTLYIDPEVIYIEKEKSVTVSIRLPQKLHEQLTFKARQENSDFSKYCRRLLEKGVSVEAYKEDIDFITRIIRSELENTIEPYGNRQIKMFLLVFYLHVNQYLFLSGGYTRTRPQPI